MPRPPVATAATPRVETEATSPVVSAARRGTGRAVAVVLLVGLIAAAVWFAVHMARRGVSAVGEGGRASPEASRA